METCIVTNPLKNHLRYKKISFIDSTAGNKLLTKLFKIVSASLNLANV